MLWVFVLAGVAACPYVLAAWWGKRWFRLLWWAALAMLIAGIAQRFYA